MPHSLIKKTFEVNKLEPDLIYEIRPIKIHKN